MRKPSSSSKNKAAATSGHNWFAGPTALPVFVGYTQKALAPFDGSSLIGKPTSLSSLAEFEMMFGEGPDLQFSVDKNQAILKNDSIWYLHDAVRLYFENKGAECLILSVGTYRETVTSDYLPEWKNNAPDAETILSGVKKLAETPGPQPNLIVLPDAQVLDKASATKLFQDVLAHCSERGDRVLLMDVPMNRSEVEGLEPVNEFRESIGTENLSFGAAYFPYLKSILYSPGDLTPLNVQGGIRSISGALGSWRPPSGLASLIQDYSQLRDRVLHRIHEEEDGIYTSWVERFMASNAHQDKRAVTDKIEMLQEMWRLLVRRQTGEADALLDVSLRKTLKKRLWGKDGLSNILSQLYLYDAAFPGEPLGVLSPEWLERNEIPQNDKVIPAGRTGSVYPTVVEVAEEGRLLGFLHNALGAFLMVMEELAGTALSQIREATVQAMESDDAFGDFFRNMLTQANVQPASGGVAGLYVSTDNRIGIWKAPAGRNLKLADGPLVPMDNRQQLKLSEGGGTGKPVNAIRSFIGKGAAVVWGSRTLGGEAEEFRYVHIRRTVIWLQQVLIGICHEMERQHSGAALVTATEQELKGFLRELKKKGALVGEQGEDRYSIDVQSEGDGLKVEIGVALLGAGEFLKIQYPA